MTATHTPPSEPLSGTEPGRASEPLSGTEPGRASAPPPGLPTVTAVRLASRAENFPVASRLLPDRYRRHLLALYGWARLVDDIGDRSPGDRPALLDWAEAELARALAGQEAHPLVAAVAASVRDGVLPAAELRLLIEANRRDQATVRYATFDELLGYCRLSANPVGRCVLSVFGVDDPAAVADSDAVCSGLQIVEHLQDVKEDAEAGRVYLPLDDMVRFGCTDADLIAGAAGPALRGLVAYESWRARQLLARARPLMGRLHGAGRWAVAGFAAGGEAALDAIAAARYDVLAAATAPRARTTARHAVALLAVGRRR